MIEQQIEEQISLFDPDGWFGKMSQEHLVATEEKTSKPFSPKSSVLPNRTLPMCLCLTRGSGLTTDVSTTTWVNGVLPGVSMMHSIGAFHNGESECVCLRTSMDSPHQGSYLTINIGEKPRTARPSKLSEILVDNADPKYNLSPKACLGILNRAKKRGKKLPPQLEMALRIQAGLDEEEEENCPFESSPDGGKCLNSWDVQSKHIQPEDGIAESLYAGECRGGGGESYVMARGTDLYNGNFTDDVAAAMTAATGRIANASGPTVLVEKHSLLSGKKVSGVVTKGNGDTFISPERHTSLSTGGGEAGQGYPCVLIEEEPKEPLVLESSQDHATITDSGVCPTLPASMGMGGGYIPMVVEGADMYNGELTGEVACTLNASSCNSATHSGPTVIQAVPINTMVGTRTTDEKRTTFGVGKPDDPQFTLQAGHSHAVFVGEVYGIDQQGGKGGANFTINVAPTLASNSHGTPHAISFQERAGKPGGGKGILIQDERIGSLVAGNTQAVFCFEGNGSRESHHGDGYKETEVMFTLNTVEQHSVAVIDKKKVAAGFKGGQSKDGGLGYEDEKAPTLSATPSALESTVFIQNE